MHGPKIAARLPNLVTVLPWETFCYPGWEKGPVDTIFSREGIADPQLDQGYAIHLFESHSSFSSHLNQLSEEAIRTMDTNFNRLVRPLLE